MIYKKWRIENEKKCMNNKKKKSEESKIKNVECRKSRIINV